MSSSMVLPKFTVVISGTVLIQMRHYEALDIVSALRHSYLPDLSQQFHIAAGTVLGLSPFA
jgi:hypothetical protein